MNKETQALRMALKSTISELQKLTPLLQTDENGNGPDCSKHFQVICDATHALNKTYTGVNNVKRTKGNH